MTPSAKAIAANILGLEPEEMTDNDEIRDAAGELLNIMTGNFKSNLCDAGLDCKLQPPKVGMTGIYSPRSNPAAASNASRSAPATSRSFVEVTVFASISPSWTAAHKVPASNASAPTIT
jgi:CheY-specific phosphatase CheX